MVADVTAGWRKLGDGRKDEHLQTREDLGYLVKS